MYHHFLGYITILLCLVYMELLTLSTYLNAKDLDRSF